MKTYKQNETPEFEMIRAAAPEDEGARQYYFIEQARILWKQQFDGLVDSGEAAARYEGSLLSELQAEGKFLNQSGLRGLFLFAEDEKPRRDRLTANTLSEPRLLHYYLEAEKDWE